MAAVDEEKRKEEPLDTSVRLVTPERITFQYPLAGPSRRALAYLIDVVVMAVLLVVGTIIATLFSLGTQAGVGLILAFMFALFMGYGASCESLFNGQTVGKMALGIRVVGDQGVPITAAQAFLRNLIWPFDGLPLGYLPAVACMVLTKKFQRLGDLAAGTMVMVEQRPSRGGIARVDPEIIRPVLRWLPTRVEAGPEMARALSDYVKQRVRFGRDRREEMAGHLARPLRERYQIPADVPGDAVLCAVYHRVFVGD